MANPTIKQIMIDDQALPKPPEFSPQRQDIYAGEITTCTGKIIADRIGWKYADMTLSWPALTQAEVDILVGMSGPCTLKFHGLDGNLHVQTVVRTSVVGLRNRNTIGGTVYWRDVTVSIRFLNPLT